MGAVGQVNVPGDGLDRVGQERSNLDPTTLTASDTDALLLTAMLEQMLSRPLEIIAKGLVTANLDEIEIGLRSKAARRFGGSTGLALFALTEAIHPNRSELTNVLVHSLAEAVGRNGVSPEQAVLDLGRAYFNAVCDDPCLTFQTFAWLAARDNALLRAAFVELYDSLDERVSQGLAWLLGEWGRHVAPRSSLREIAVVLTSLFEGLAMRTAVHPDSVDEPFPSEVALNVILGMTEPCDGNCRH